MPESARKARSPLPLLAAALLFVPAFGAGVFVGRSIPERRPPATEKSTGYSSDPRVRIDRSALASCQEQLTAPPDAPAPPSTNATPLDDVKADAGRPPATVEALEAELKRCKTSTRLVNAEVCSAAARQLDALMALPKDGLMCGPKSRAADLIEENFERCDDFIDSAAGGSAEDLTKEEARLIAEAIRVRRAYPDEEVLRRLKEFAWTCTETPPKYPPGIDWSKRLDKRKADERAPQQP
jgi:hypothetical protein